MNDKVFEETGALDTPIRAALDCAKAKNLLRQAEIQEKDARMEMDMAKDRLLAFEYEKTEDLEVEKLAYPVGTFQPSHGSFVLELRRVKDAPVYSEADRVRVDGLKATLAALKAEIARVPAASYTYRWNVWLVDAPEKPSKKK